MEHYWIKSLTESETAAMIERIQKNFAKYGFGLFACIVKETSQFIGYVGLHVPTFTAHFTPAVEIGWRLASSAWCKGYATEAAYAVLKAAFEKYNLKEVVSFTVPMNQRSRRVMEKIGMTYNPKDDFCRPEIPLDSPLSHHVLYRITKEQFMQSSHE
jgi:RimJ/RimL family protein N-acetyltransferase